MAAILPSLDHFTLEDSTNVYEPSDDTFLFCDALCAEKNALEMLNPKICVEIGY